MEEKKSANVALIAVVVVAIIGVVAYFGHHLLT